MVSGRFGNQADHFLGSLGFAHGLNRTLVLPPWVEYRYGEPKSIQVPFDTYFKVEPLLKFHKVITMEEFMKEIAPYEWPADKRTSFCYMQRGIDTYIIMSVYVYSSTNNIYRQVATIHVTQNKEIPLDHSGTLSI